MPNSKRLDWLQSGLFWRTFLLLAALITCSMLAWFASLRLLERTPIAQQLASQVVSIVTLTRAALTHSAPEQQRELLLDLASNDGIRVYIRDDGDEIEPVASSPLMDDVKALISLRLGMNTQFARQLNGIEDFWVSFEIEGEEYWLRLDEERVQPATGVQLLSWISLTLVLALLAAALLSKRLNEPLARLSAAARQLANGMTPDMLAETGPREVRETNASFNQMVSELAQLENDRAIILAGISHDLRTPLTRMQLEIEMAGLSEDARLGMQSDLTQMDAIIAQFLDYAKPQSDAAFELINFTELVQNTANNAQRHKDLRLTVTVANDIRIKGNATELQRLLNNLIENARRYGKTPNSEFCDLEIECTQNANDKTPQVRLAFRDHGPGVPEEALATLLRPFTRADSSRSQANGSGLGLAIVERIVKRHGGSVSVSNHTESGFLVQITL
jgi:two-component system, OmpR family, osmolarity sensor histidine kinase EnvZ